MDNFVFMVVIVGQLTQSVDHLKSTTKIIVIINRKNHPQIKVSTCEPLTHTKYGI